MGLGIGTIVGAAATVATGGLAAPALYVGYKYDQSKANEEAMRNAAAATQGEYIQATELAIQAQKDAEARAIEYAKTRREEDRVAAEAAAAKAEQAILAANQSIEIAVQQGVDTSNAQFQQAYQTIQTQLNPWIQTGTQANEQINKLMFGTAGDIQSALEATPGYQFRQKMATQGVDRSASARGNLSSGNTMIEAAKVGANLGSDEYMNALNRLNMLSQQGYGAATQLGGYTWQKAGTSAAGAEKIANARSQNALNLANTKAQGAYNVSDAARGANAGVAQTGIQGAWNVGNAVGQGAYSDAAAKANAINMNMNADIMGNNFWPNMLDQGIQTGVALAPLAFGAPPLGAFNIQSNSQNSMSSAPQNYGYNKGSYVL